MASITVNKINIKHMAEEIKQQEVAKQTVAGLQQSGAPPKPADVKPDNNPLPPSLRGHKSVPLHPYQSMQNSECDFDMDTKAKSTEQCVAEHKARIATASK